MYCFIFSLLSGVQSIACWKYALCATLLRIIQSNITNLVLFVLIWLCCNAFSVCTLLVHFTVTTHSQFCFSFFLCESLVREKQKYTRSYGIPLCQFSIFPLSNFCCCQMKSGKRLPNAVFRIRSKCYTNIYLSKAFCLTYTLFFLYFFFFIFVLGIFFPFVICLASLKQTIYFSYLLRSMFT